MKKLLLVLVVLAIAGAAVWWFRFRQTGGSPVQPELARIYEQVARDDLGARTSQPDAAITALQDVHGKDPGNAMTDYMLAAAYARKRDWATVQRELDEGNKAPYCLYYITDAAAFPVMPENITLRQLARDCVAAEPKLPPKTAVALLQGLRGMAANVARSQPRGVIPVLVACALRVLADRGLVTAAARTHDRAEIDSARRLQTADKNWVESTRADIKAAMQTTDMNSMVTKHLTPQEWQATQQGTVVTPETRDKLAALHKDIDAFEGPLADRAVTAMPK